LATWPAQPQKLLRRSDLSAAQAGLSLTNLLSTAGPDRFIRRLSGRLDDHHGEVRLHF
jgi:hypothetical protein